MAVYSSTFFLGCAGNLLILLSVASHGQVNLPTLIIFQMYIYILHLFSGLGLDPEQRHSLISYPRFIKTQRVYLSFVLYLCYTCVTFVLHLCYISVTLVLHVNFQVRQNPTSVFLASLATADLLLLTVCLPLKMAKLFTFSWQVMK